MVGNGAKHLRKGKTMTDLFGHAYPLSREQILAAAGGWDELAEQELARPTWDRDALRSIVTSKAELYRQTAREILASISGA
jgi:hypothetical protein